MGFYRRVFGHYSRRLRDWMRRVQNQFPNRPQGDQTGSQQTGPNVPENHASDARTQNHGDSLLQQAQGDGSLPKRPPAAYSPSNDLESQARSQEPQSGSKGRRRPPPPPPPPPPKPWDASATHNKLLKDLPEIPAEAPEKSTKERAETPERGNERRRSQSLPTTQVETPRITEQQRRASLPTEEFPPFDDSILQQQQIGTDVEGDGQANESSNGGQSGNGDQSGNGGQSSTPTQRPRTRNVVSRRDSMERPWIKDEGDDSSSKEH